MSCIRFNTPAQQRQLDRLKEDPRLGNDPVSQFVSPELTDSKIERLRRMAKDRRPQIRESAALNSHTPVEVMWDLARDPSVSVRSCVARNEATPCDILRHLAGDSSPEVRSWVAVNFFVPADAMETLSHDADDQVRRLVAWKASLAPSSVSPVSALSSLPH